MLNIEQKKKQSFQDVLDNLGISEYAERIFNSNSHGELFHLADYWLLSDLVANEAQRVVFKALFKGIVKAAEEQWSRPESVFQHMPRIIYEYLNRSLNA